MRHPLLYLGFLLALLSGGLAVAGLLHADATLGTPWASWLLLAAALGTLAILSALFFSSPQPSEPASPQSPRRAELQSLQRLTQIIQRGQTTVEVYSMLLESAVQTVQADAAWLDLDPSHAGLEATAATQLYNLLPAQAEELRALLQHNKLPEGEFLTNDLNLRPGFEHHPQHYRSLLQLPLRGLHFNYGMLYLLKVEPNTFRPRRP